MDAVTEIAKALGTPLLLRHVSMEVGPIGAVARWRHGDARIATSNPDAAQIIFSLSGDQIVEQRVGRYSIERRSSVGGICILSPNEPAVTEVRGCADVLQIFVGTPLLEEVAQRRVSQVNPLFDSRNAQLQPAVMQAFVAVYRGEPDDPLLLASSIYRIAEQLARPVENESTRLARGGLAPAARRRVDELITARLEQEDAPPRLDELAAAAGLSIHHFIKAFRQDAGVTPHLYVLDLRIQRAMGLLAKPVGTVGDVSYRMGFASPSHFVSAFRRRMGVTPGAFRNAVLG